MSSDLAIRVDGLSKCYQIYQSPRDRLKQALLSRARRHCGLAGKDYFQAFWALQDVCLEVNRGETVGIIGRNGSGKSTLLQIICGTLAPTGGTVETRGRVAALLELGAGFNPDFTGRENIYMNAALLGLRQQEIDARYADIVSFADIGDFVDRPVKTYSSGMYVRLAFAVIAHVDADLLIIDEALAVGDAFFTQKCMRFLREFQKNGTILFVSHDTGAVINLCRRAIWLHSGGVRKIGPAKEVCEAYLAASFEEQQGKSSLRPVATPSFGAKRRATADQRLQYLNRSRFRNDIEIFDFRPEEPFFGKGGARITEVCLLDENCRALSWVVGGEEVTLIIQAVAGQDLPRPILGFYLKDRLGQYLFGDNTFLTNEGPAAVQARAGETLEARFHFRMPVLPVGDYSVCAAVAEGTQEHHVQHQWIHDALMLKSHASSVITGMLGIPMEQITLENLSLPGTAESC